MYYVGIDISKYKQDGFIRHQSSEPVVNDFVFVNSTEWFVLLIKINF